tara:strand:- start:180 stop:740 length:561 start_codon:yes stop_codon:yes gene_type:complete
MEIKMKITRKQLRRLIETTIKPSIPNVPSEDLLGKIDDFARDKEMQPDADSFAGSFGYPEDRSYVEDLGTYDAAGRAVIDTVYVKPMGQTEAEVLEVPIPYELVDKVIEAYEDVTSEEGNMNSSRYAIPYDELRDAGVDIFRHIHNHLDGKYGRDNYDIYSYGVEGAHGYRDDAYGKAMEKVGEVF